MAECSARGRSWGLMDKPSLTTKGAVLVTSRKGGIQKSRRNAASESQTSKRQLSINNVFGRRGIRFPSQTASAGNKSIERNFEIEKKIISLVAAGFASCCVWIDNLNGVSIPAVYSSDSNVARAYPALISEPSAREQEIQDLVSGIESETSNLEIAAELMGAKKNLINEAEKKVEKLNRVFAKSDLASKQLIKARSDIQKLKSELVVLESALKTTASPAPMLEYGPDTGEPVNRPSKAPATNFQKPTESTIFSAQSLNGLLGLSGFVVGGALALVFSSRRNQPYDSVLNEIRSKADDVAKKELEIEKRIREYEIDKLTQSLGAAVREKEELSEKIAQLQRDFLSYKSEISDENKVPSALPAQEVENETVGIRSINGMSVSRSAAPEAKRDTAPKKDNELQHMHAVLSELQDKYSELEVRYLASTENYDLLLHRTAKLQAELSLAKDKAARIEEIQVEKSKTVEETTRLMSELEQEKKKSSSIEYASQAAQEALQEQYNTSSKAMQDTINSLTCKVEALQETLQEEKLKVEEVTNEKKDLEFLLEAVREAHVDEANKFMNEYKEQEKQMQILSQQNSSLETVSQELEESLRTLCFAADAAKDANLESRSYLTEEVHRRESENERLAMESSELCKQISSLQAQLGELEYAALAAKDAFDSQGEEIRRHKESAQAQVIEQGQELEKLRKILSEIGNTTGIVMNTVIEDPALASEHYLTMKAERDSLAQRAETLQRESENYQGMEFAAIAASEAFTEEISNFHSKMAKSQDTLVELEALRSSISEANQRQEETDYLLSAFKDAMQMHKETHEKRVNDLMEKNNIINQQYLEEIRRSRELECAKGEIEFAAVAARDANVAEKSQMVTESAKGNGNNGQNGSKENNGREVSNSAGLVVRDDVSNSQGLREISEYKEALHQVELELEDARQKIQEGSDIEFAMSAVLDVAKDKLHNLKLQNSKLSMELEGSKEASDNYEKDLETSTKSIEELKYAAVAAGDALRADLNQLKIENATLQTRLVESTQEATEAQVELTAIKMAKDDSNVSEKESSASDDTPSTVELENRIQEIEYAAEAAVAAVVDEAKTKSHSNSGKKKARGVSTLASKTESGKQRRSSRGKRKGPVSN